MHLGGGDVVGGKAGRAERERDSHGTPLSPLLYSPKPGSIRRMDGAKYEKRMGRYGKSEVGSSKHVQYAGFVHAGMQVGMQPFRKRKKNKKKLR